jgi:hypothetical protein
MSPKSKNLVKLSVDQKKLELIYQLVCEFANRNITQYSTQELELITMFLRRYSMIRGTMNLQLQEHRLATVYIDSIQQDFKQIKKLKASQRKVLKDFGLQEVIKEIETFINEQQQHVSANRLLGNTGQ